MANFMVLAVHNFKLNILYWNHSFKKDLSSPSWPHLWMEVRGYNWADLQCWHSSQACLTRGLVCLDCKPGKFALTNVYLCVQTKSIMIVQDILQVWTSIKYPGRESSRDPSKNLTPIIL